MLRRPITLTELGRFVLDMGSYLSYAARLVLSEQVGFLAPSHHSGRVITS